MTLDRMRPAGDSSAVMSDTPSFSKTLHTVKQTQAEISLSAEALLHVVQGTPAKLHRQNNFGTEDLRISQAFFSNSSGIMFDNYTPAAYLGEDSDEFPASIEWCAAISVSIIPACRSSMPCMTHGDAFY